MTTQKRTFCKKNVFSGAIVFADFVDENNDVSIDNSRILVLLHPFDRTADVTGKKPSRNGIKLCKILHLGGAKSQLKN